MDIRERIKEYSDFHVLNADFEKYQKIKDTAEYLTYQGPDDYVENTKHFNCKNLIWFKIVNGFAWMEKNSAFNPDTGEPAIVYQTEHVWIPDERRKNKPNVIKSSGEITWIRDRNKKLSYLYKISHIREDMTMVIPFVPIKKYNFDRYIHDLDSMGIDVFDISDEDLIMIDAKFGGM